MGCETLYDAQRNDAGLTRFFRTNSRTIARSRDSSPHPQSWALRLFVEMTFFFIALIVNPNQFAMSSKVLLRIAAVLMFVHCVLHTIGFNSWKDDPDKQGVVKAMNGPKFPFMGASRNMANFYDGFGYASSIAMILIFVSLWLVSGELGKGSSLARKMTLTLAFILLLWGADEIIYFFLLAAAMSWVAALCCLVAYFRTNKA